MECKNISDANNNMGNWNHLKNIHKIPEQHTRKTQNQEVQKQPYWALHIYFQKY
jgi:hypothetical protein